jgi:hypothetical protein
LQAQGLRVSPFRIVRIVDREGEIQSIRNRTSGHGESILFKNPNHGVSIPDTPCINPLIRISHGVSMLLLNPTPGVSILY